MVQLDWIFTFTWDMGKLDRFLLAPLVTLSFSPLLSRFCFCFTFAFGALHAPGSFDLGQKEIGN